MPFIHERSGDVSPILLSSNVKEKDNSKVRKSRMVLERVIEIVRIIDRGGMNYTVG